MKRRLLNTEWVYLKQLKTCLYIKIPNLIISPPLLAAPEQALDGDCFIYTENNSGDVEQEEAEDSCKQNYSPVEVIPLLLLSLLSLRWSWNCSVQLQIHSKESWGKLYVCLPMTLISVCNDLPRELLTLLIARYMQLFR